MSAPSTGTTVLSLGLDALRAIIQEWETRNPPLHITAGFLGDGTGGKPQPRDQPKPLFLARVSAEDLAAAEPMRAAGTAATFSLRHPIDGATEVLPIVGAVRDGEPEFWVEAEVARGYFSGLGRVGEVRVVDAVGDEEGRVRREERRGRKREKRRRQREGRKGEERQSQSQGEGQRPGGERASVEGNLRASFR